MSNARVNRLMSALRSMLEYASNEEDYEDEIEINYASKVKGLQKEDSIINNTEREYPLSFLWKLNKNLTKLEDNYNVLLSLTDKIKNKYANEKYSERVDGDSWQVKPEFLSDFQDEMNKCYEIEEEYDIDSIKIDEIKEYKMTLPEFNSISFMIED